MFQVSAETVSGRRDSTGASATSKEKEIRALMWTTSPWTSDELMIDIMKTFEEYWHIVQINTKFYGTVKNANDNKI